MTPDLLAVLVLVGVVVALSAVGRRRREERRRAARTVELVIDDSGVHRRLGDGRDEAVSWGAVRSAEVVCTPVATADGARSFVLLAEAEMSGCLVPLGVGHDDVLLIHLSRLPGFRIEGFQAARTKKAPARTVCWERS